MQSPTFAMALDAVHSFRLSLWSEPLAVRDATKKSARQWRDWGASVDLCDTAEIVLAEVLNNVVEHAHKGQEHGALVLVCAYDGDVLSFEVRDDGVEMPGGTLPKGAQQSVETAMQDLPEGGFGWHLIREMTDSLSYRRDGAWNILTFSVRPD